MGSFLVIRAIFSADFSFVSDGQIVFSTKSGLMLMRGGFILLDPKFDWWHMLFFLLFSTIYLWKKNVRELTTKKNRAMVAPRNGSSNGINPNHFARRVFVSRPEKTAAFHSRERRRRASRPSASIGGIPLGGERTASIGAGLHQARA